MNKTTEYLFQYVFNQNSLEIFKTLGFVSFYLEDYGHKKIYKNCVLALFDFKNKSTGKLNQNILESLEDKLSSFEFFQDYYEITETKKMYVFKINKELLKDFMSGNIYNIGLLKETGDVFNFNEEIYRYEKYFTSEKEK